MHDCCIRVTTLLEYFERKQISNTASQRAKGVIFCTSFLTMLVVGVDFNTNQLFKLNY